MARKKREPALEERQFGTIPDQKSLNCFFSSSPDFGKVSGLVQELGKIDITDEADLSAVAEALRRKVYVLGLGGGYANLKDQAAEYARREQTEVEHMVYPIREENTPSYYNRFRAWRTFFAIRALNAASDAERENLLGELRARFRKKPQLARVPNLFTVTDEGQILANVDLDIRKAPLDLAVDIVAFTQNEHLMSEFEGQNKAAQRALLIGLGREAHIRLIKALITDDPKLIKWGIEYFTSQDYERFIRRMPGDLGEGRFGRKAAGMEIAYSILRKEDETFDREFLWSSGFITATPEIKAKQAFLVRARTMNGEEKARNNFEIEQAEGYLKRIEDQAFAVFKRFKEGSLVDNFSLPLGSNLLNELINANNRELGVLHDLKRIYESDPELFIRMEQGVRSKINDAKFPEYIERHLKEFYEGLVDKLGGNPFIVRSSSEMEDREDASFAGLYDSVVCSGRKDRFDEFLAAIKTVFKSLFTSDVFKYRAKHDLLNEVETMGLFIQRLNGKKRGKYFFPSYAGVISTRSVQSPEPDPTKGQVTMVTGLGDTAVREGGDIIWCAKFQYKLPFIQDSLDAVNMETGEFEHVPASVILSDTIRDQADFNDSFYARAARELVSRNVDRLCTSDESLEGGEIDFKKVVDGDRCHLPLLLHYFAEKLKRAMGTQLEIEFTADKNPNNRYEVQIVQCRPENISEKFTPSKKPANIPDDQVLFDISGSLNCGTGRDIRYIMYIGSTFYDREVEGAMSTEQVATLHDWIAKVNDRLPEGSYFMIVPGRLGNRSGQEGVPGNVNDFDRANGFMEVCGIGKWREVPPASGTHDFHRLMERGILPVVCDVSKKEGGYAGTFEALRNADSVLPQILDNIEIPDHVQRWLKIVDVEALGRGKKIGNARLQLAMTNGTGGVASLYLSPEGENLPVKA
ncbi:MAG: pyruvate phosphate dikinase PEP/pyruvate-binding protein [Candidatus Peregrinibacteria bacterium GW2011_GWF2_39_17]|nr:MAG: pyruvate phosphate dikinase PEP/pyruvate-binding protein [Candidatus Peregrinibacteria bacterium GW2011_GWF2_39_17]